MGVDALQFLDQAESTSQHSSLASGAICIFRQSVEWSKIILKKKNKLFNKDFFKFKTSIFL